MSSLRGEECSLTYNRNVDIPGGGDPIRGFEARKAFLRLGDALCGDSTAAPRNELEHGIKMGGRNYALPLEGSSGQNASNNEGREEENGDDTWRDHSEGR